MKPMDELPARSRIGSYEFVRVLGKGAFAITYLARDLRTEGRKVAIKEFFPHSLARRARSGMVESFSGMESEFENLKINFVKEGELLRSLDHPNLTNGIRTIKTNGSAYHIMRYETGKSLKEILRRQEKEVRGHPQRVFHLAKGLLRGVEQLHRKGYLHCDIKPANIFIGADWNPVLIDMGSALKLGPNGVEQRSSIEWSDHYSPAEQLKSGSGELGPWTDIYSVAAVLYRCISGGRIPKTEERLQGFDTYMELAELKPEGYGESFCRAIDLALSLSWKGRPSSIQDFRMLLSRYGGVDVYLDHLVNLGIQVFSSCRGWCRDIRGPERR